jgi:hypothetical protein
VLLDFAEWAFSTEGLPNLQILAYGDFSYEGRYAEYNALLCRDHVATEPKQVGFRALTDADIYLWDLLDNNMGVLMACATEVIMGGGWISG